MKWRILVITAVLVFVSGFLFNACKFSTAKVGEVVMCKKFDDQKLPTDKTTLFTIGDNVIHCGVKVVNVPSDTKLKAIWYQTNPATKEKKELIRSDFSVSDDRWIDFFITPPSQGFTAGQYIVEVLLNDKMTTSQTFTIEGPTANPIVEYALIAGTDAGGKLQEMYVFSPAVDIIHAQLKIKAAPATTKFEAIWYQLAAASKDKYKIVLTDLVAGGPDVLDFTLRPTKPLPVSRYSVDMLIDGVLSNTLFFEVKEK